MVWLNLVPLFGMVWMFVTYLRVSESLKNEFRDRGWHRRDEDYGQMLGVISSALVMGSGALGYCGFPFLIAGFVCWVMYWTKVANFSSQIADPYRKFRDHYDDDYEDREEEFDHRAEQDYERHERENDRKPWER